MDLLVRRLNKTSTLKRKESFQYTIKRDQHNQIFSCQGSEKASENPTILNARPESGKSSPKECSSVTTPSHQRSKLRHNTTNEVSCHLNQRKNSLLNLYSPKNSKKTVDLPLDFSSSFKSIHKAKNIIQEESSSDLGIEKSQQTPKFDKESFFPDNYKDISELSSSKEVSFPEPKPKQVKNKVSVSVELEKEEYSVYNSPDRYSIQPNRKILNSSMDFTLETDKFPESPKIIMNSICLENEKNSVLSKLSVRKSIPSKTEIRYMSFDEALSRFNDFPIEFTDVYL